MEEFEKLPEAVNELVDSFIAQPVAGNLNFGITQYTVFMFAAIAFLCVVLFIFMK